MTIKKNIFLFCFAVIVTVMNLNAQTSVDRQVINSTGGTGNAGSNFIVDFNVGEVVINTAIKNNVMLTQGFLQPDTVFNSSSIFSINTYYSNESCMNANDAFISLTPQNAVGNVSYLWLPGGQTTAGIFGVSPGQYVFIATDSAGTSVSDTILISASTGPCNLIFNNGITPNTDGKNDFFTIENIESYPQNELFIYNRYGSLIWQTKNYNNVTNVFDGKDKNGFDLPAATYFFVLHVNDTQTKGYIELLR